MSADVASRPDAARPRPAAAGAHRRRRRRGAVLFWQFGTLVGLVLLWWLTWATQALPRALVPAPWEVAVGMATLAGTGAFWAALWATLSGALVALAVAVLIGVPVGLLLGTVPALYRATQLIIDVGRSFPTVALLPVMILVLGATTRMKVVVILFAVVWPILLQTYDGARRIDPVVADTAAAYRIPRGLRFVKVTLPNAAPFTVTGIRIAASAAILIALGVEVLTQTPGMGGNLARAQTDGAPALALAYLGYAGLVGWALYRVLAGAEDRVLVWSRRTGGGRP